MTIVLERTNAAGESAVVASTPEAISWSGGSDDSATRSSDARSLSKARRVRGELVAMRLTSREEVRVPIEFRRRSSINGHTSLAGQDPHGIVKVRVAITSRDTLHFKVTIRPPEGTTPGAILPILHFNQVLNEGGRFGLWLDATNDWAATPTEAAGLVPPVPQAYLGAVDALARIQASTGVEFAMPQVIGERDADGINMALKLLTGRRVEVGWTDATLAHDVAELQDLGLDIVGSRHREVQTVTPVELDIAGNCVALGDFVAQFHSVEVTEIEPVADEPDEVIVRLQPGDDGRAVLQLLARSYFDPFDRKDLERVVIPGDTSRPGIRALLGP